MTWTTRPRSKIGALAAIEDGAGPRVMLLHGVGLRAEAWNAQIDALAPQFSVTALDLPGHGESAPLTPDPETPDAESSDAESSEAPTLTDYVAMTAAAIDRARQGDPVGLVGHSMGALIALELAIMHPDAVRGVVALNAIYRRTPAATDAVRRRAAALDGVQAADPSATLARWFGDRASPEAEACRAWLKNVDPAAYKAAYAAFAHADGPADAALRSMSAPALFITGADEPNSTPAMSKAMAALAPSGDVVVIEGAAHMAPMTHAADVNAALAAFFQERGA